MCCNLFAIGGRSSKFWFKPICAQRILLTCDEIWATADGIPPDSNNLHGRAWSEIWCSKPFQRYVLGIPNALTTQLLLGTSARWGSRSPQVGAWGARNFRLRQILNVFGVFARPGKSRFLASEWLPVHVPKTSPPKIRAQFAV